MTHKSMAETPGVPNPGCTLRFPGKGFENADTWAALPQALSEFA